MSVERAVRTGIGASVGSGESARDGEDVRKVGRTVGEGEGKADGTDVQTVGSGVGETDGDADDRWAGKLVG